MGLDRPWEKHKSEKIKESSKESLLCLGGRADS